MGSRLATEIQCGQMSLRGQQPTGPAGDGVTQVVSAKCLMSLSSHLEPRGDRSSLIPFHKIDSGAVSITLSDVCYYTKGWERSGSVVECLTRDRRAAGSSLTGVTALWSLSKTHLS